MIFPEFIKKRFQRVQVAGNLIKISCLTYATAMNVQNGSVYWTADFNQIEVAGFVVDDIWWLLAFLETTSYW